MKKIIFGITIALAVLVSFVSCGTKKTEVYFLNFKPEIADVYTEKVVPAFEKENPGYTLKVVTAASGSYTQTLQSEMAKSNPPVIFQTNGPVGLASSKDYATSLDSTGFYALLADKTMALKLDGYVAAVPYAVEGYGIIYNDAIMQKYFALPTKKSAIKSMDEIKNFGTLKEVVEDMQANKGALGIEGVFASTSMSAGNQWRWQTHTVNVPLYYEFFDKNKEQSPLLTGLSSETIQFTYGGNFKNLIDLYTNNSTTAKTLLGAKSVDDSMAEFALEQCAMVQNGNWAASQIIGTQGNKVQAENIKFLPLYMGITGEENTGICVGTENYLCINKNASEAAQQGADIFLTWLFSSTTGKALVSNDLMFITPFNSFGEGELPADPLSQQVSIWMTKPGITSIPWSFNAIPSEDWKNAFGSAILSYFEGKSTWTDVNQVAVNEWQKEWAIANGK